MIRVITINVNGIRSASNKGFLEWMVRQEADVICLQETKSQMLTHELYRPSGFYSYFSDAEKKGYSGVGIYCRKKPDRVIDKLGWDCADCEGRYLQIDYGDLSIASLYMPSGTTGEERQAVKFNFLEHYRDVLKKIRHGNRDFIICGDWNIAHKMIDLKNWRSNQVHSGFLPEERIWIDTLFNEIGLVDAFRTINQESDQYTWWSSRGRAREKNVGWRIDYQVVTPSLKNKIKFGTVYRDQFFSDHAPLIIDYDLEL